MPVRRAVGAPRHSGEPKLAGSDANSVARISGRECYGFRTAACPPRREAQLACDDAGPVWRGSRSIDRRVARAGSTRRRDCPSQRSGSPRRRSRGTGRCLGRPVAVRACLLISASSPKWSPGPSLATSRPSTVTDASPSTMTKNPTPLICPCWTTRSAESVLAFGELARQLLQLSLAEAAEERDALESSATFDTGR